MTPRLPLAVIGIVSGFVTQRSRLYAAALLAVASGAGVAAAKRVMPVPTISRSCPGAPSWTKVEACLARRGTVKVLKSERDVRLVQMTSDQRGGFRVPGVYLYTRARDSWRIGGAIEGDGLSLIGFRRVHGDFDGFQIDVSSLRVEELILGDERVHEGHLRQTYSAFCSGTSPGCGLALVACDVYVDGKAYWTFRGKIAFTRQVLTIEGDRTAAGDLCQAPDEVAVPSRDDDFE